MRTVKLNVCMFLITAISFVIIKLFHGYKSQINDCLTFNIVTYIV